MPAISEREKPVVDILARVNALDIESLLRKELGAFAFAQARPNIELTFQMTRALAQSELSLLPARMLKRVEEFARSVFSLFTEISRLSPNTASASERDRLSNNLATYYQDYFNDLALFLGYSSTRAAGLERISERIRQADALLAEMEKMRDSAKQAVQEQAVSRYAVYFQQDADTHRMAGYGWLFVTIVLFAVTAVLIWHEFVHASLTAFQAFSAPQSIQFAVGEGHLRLATPFCSYMERPHVSCPSPQSDRKWASIQRPQDLRGIHQICVGSANQECRVTADNQVYLLAASQRLSDKRA